MLLAMAEAARTAGWNVGVIGPDAPMGVTSAAATAGFDTVALAPDRARYMRELRAWDRGRSGILWCNGLVPALATSGRARRIVHIHRRPRGFQRLALLLSRMGDTKTVVPSRYLGADISADHILWNWTQSHAVRPAERVDEATRIGYIGRWSHEKGIDVLTQAIETLSSRYALELVLAGEPRFRSGTTLRTIEEELDALRSPMRKLGWLSFTEFVAEVDVIVVPSREPEAFGLVAIEAASAHVPVIVTDAGALGEVMGEEYPWVARANDPADLSRIVELFLTTEESERSRVITRSYKRWEEHFSPRAGEKRFQDLLSHFAQGLS